MSLFDSASLIVTPNAYKAGKLYSIKPTDGSGDLSVTRATSATRVNSNELIESVASNVPRIDYTNGSCPSILVEPQRTNLFLRSEEFDNASWATNAINIDSDEIISPNGLQTADFISENTALNAHFMFQGVGTTTTSSYTISIFAKHHSRILQIFAGGGDVSGNPYANFDLENGVVNNNGCNDAFMQYYGNGWYRCVVVVTSAVTSGFNPCFGLVSTLNSSRAAAYQGDGTSGIYLWGAQLEAGANATSYIPTVASAVTRNADVISKTGISDLIGQTEGALFVDVEFDYVSNTFSNFISINNNINTQAISLNRESNNRIQFFIFNSGVQANLLTTNNSNGKFKIIGTYKSNEFKLFVNGVLIGTDTSGTLPTLSTFNLGNIVGSSIQKNNINSAALWKTALTDQECINLTSI